MVFRTYKRGVKVAIVGAVALAAWALSLGLGLFGPGGGGGTDGPKAAPTEPAEPSPVADGVLSVRIEGRRLLVAGKEMSVEQIGILAEKHQARVVVQWATDGQIGVLEQLQDELRRRGIHFEVPRS